MAAKNNHVQHIPSGTRRVCFPPLLSHAHHLTCSSLHRALRWEVDMLERKLVRIGQAGGGTTVAAASATAAGTAATGGELQKGLEALQTAPLTTRERIHR